MQGAFGKLNATMTATRGAVDPKDQTKTYNDQVRHLAELRTQMQNMAAASGQWHVQTVRTISASQALTEQIRKQKIGMRGAAQELLKYRKGVGSLGEAIKEQHALRNAMAMQMNGNVFGRNGTDLYLPKNLGSELDMARTKYGMINEMLRSASRNTINWGKNTQWAGRQITVGLTVPLGMAAVGAAHLAYQVDKNLTRIAKVYDTVATQGMAQEAELTQVREASLATATRLAGEYGQKMQDVLDITAQLAATGQQGPALFQATNEVARIATLGEMDYQDAVQMTISLQTAYKLSTQELTEAFNMMNAVENATSLSIQDIAESVPRAASALASLGGTVQEMTVMLVAMKEAGVDPAEGANALKSATTRLLNPTKAAISFFQEEFQINLPQIVKEANGNIYELMNTLAGLTRGFDDLTVQQGIGKLFGTYQFNRVTALWTNLGDAVNGVQNQTAKAMETVGMSAEDLAGIADREIERWQESIQGKFKRAVEGIKAQLVPLGLTVLQALTPVMNFVAMLIEGFNDLNPFLKNTILILLGFAAAAGPILMLTGIFANLIGNIGSFAAGIANLRLKFKALTADEAAANITARNAKSAFDTRTAAAAQLTLTIQALTAAMEQNAIAQGHMMSASGRITNQFAANDPLYGTGRTAVQRPNGSWGYAPGSIYGPNTVGKRGQNLSGQPAGGHNLRPEDAAMLAAMQQNTGQMAADSAKTATNFTKIGRAVGAIAGVGAVLASMVSMSDEFSSNMINVLMIAGTLWTLFPNIFKVAFGWLGKIKLGMEAIATGSAVSKLSAFFGAAKQGRTIGGMGGMLTAMNLAAPRFMQFATAALKIFGPLGALAGGALIIKGIVDDFQKAEETARSLASSGSDWAEALGYTFMPGQLPGMKEEDVTGHQTRIKLIEQMTEANEGLAEAMANAGSEAKAYDLAVGQALQVVTSGGTIEAATKAFEASLQMAGIADPTIKELRVKFDKIGLDDPEGVRRELERQMQGIFDDVTGNITMATNNNFSITESFRQLFGGDLTSEMRTAGIVAGQQLAQGLAAAGSDQRLQFEVFTNMKEQVNEGMSGMYDSILEGDEEMQTLFNDMGIHNADELAGAIELVAKKAEEGRHLTDNEMELLRASSTQEMQDFADAYGELLDTIIQGMVDQHFLTPEMAEILKSRISNLAGMMNQFEIRSQPPLLSASQGANMYADYLAKAELHGRALTEEQKLLYLNSLRARAGLDAATSSTQGFGAAAVGAAGDAGMLVAAFEDVLLTADQVSGAQRDAMSGAWGDIMAEADRQFNEYQAAQIDAIRSAGELRQDEFERQADAMDKDFDAREDALNNHWDAVMDRHQANAERRRETTERQWDSRIEKIQNTIDAERDAEEQRQKIFEAEQTRMQRMAQRFNDNIDFNVALNSGDLDEAAKIANDISSQDSAWAAEDANDRAKDAADKRQEALEADLERTQKAKEAALAALSEREEAEEKALQAQRKRAEESLRLERQLATDALAAKKEADQKATESAVAAAQAAADADRRELDSRLRRLQEFVPQNEKELRDHIAEVEEMYGQYGVNLQMQGDAWSKIIGTALEDNVAAAAAALQTEIKWQQIAANVASQIGEGMGMTLDQVKQFLKTGVFPANEPVTTRPWTPTTSSTKTVRSGLGPRAPVLHEGGRVPYTGGKAFSQKNRMGVPRGAEIYPTEVPSVLKVGEFIMNARATRNNLEALEAMNKGKNFPLDSHRFSSHHSGGPVSYTSGLYGLQAAAVMQMMGAAIQKRIEVAKAAAAAAAAAAAMGGMGEGILGGGNAGSGVFRAGGTWPRAIQGVVSPNTAGAVAKIKSMYPQITSVGTVGSRPNLSDHPMGKAADFMIPNWNTAGGIGLGDAVARYFIENPSAFGTKYVIWRKRITSGGGWTNYTHPNGETTNPTLNHYDHVHTSFLHKGGLANLASGGRINYGGGLRNLNSAGAAAPMLDGMRGAARSAGVGSNDTFVIDLRGSTVNSDVDVERAVEKVLKVRDSRNGRSRTIS